MRCEVGEVLKGILLIIVLCRIENRSGYYSISSGPSS